MNKLTKAAELEAQAKKLREEAEKAEQEAERLQCEQEWNEFISTLNDREKLIAEAYSEYTGNDLQHVKRFVEDNKDEPGDYIVNTYWEQDGECSVETKEEVIKIIHEKINSSYESFDLTILDINDGREIRKFKIDF